MDTSQIGPVYLASRQRIDELVRGLGPDDLAPFNAEQFVDAIID